MARRFTYLATYLAADAGLVALFLPTDKPVAASHHLVQADYARTLRSIAADGPAALYGGSLGATVATHLEAADGHVSLQDLAAYRPVMRDAVHG